MIGSNPVSSRRNKAAIKCIYDGVFLMRVVGWWRREEDTRDEERGDLDGDPVGG